MKLLLSLFMAFFQIGLFTFGGGYSMLPMLRREVVERYGWATEDELLNYFAIGQCTPGIIAVNTATFIGFKEKKLLGAVFATLGIVMPSIIIITVIAAVLGNFTHIAAVRYAFAGIRAAVGALIVSSVIRLVKSNIKNVLQAAICVISFVIVAVLGASPVWVVIGSALFGFFFMRERKKAGDGK